MTRPALFHYTCEHGFKAIGSEGYVRTMADHSPRAMTRIRPEWAMLGYLSWFTDLDVPVVDALGLTRETIYCDRTRYRYRVVDLGAVRPWMGSALRKSNLSLLENERGAMPMHWYFAETPVLVYLDPPR